MARDISNTDDVIDSRDVIARINDLESELEGYYDEKGFKDEKPDFDDWLQAVAKDSAHDRQDDAKELLALRALQEEAEGYAPDWAYGATLIRESYFVDYCRDLVSDIGDMPKEIPSYIAIDWETTAENLKVDYTEVEFDGETYLVR